MRKFARWIPPGEVDAETRRRAVDAFRACVVDLGLRQAPVLVWVEVVEVDRRA